MALIFPWSYLKWRRNNIYHYKAILAQSFIQDVQFQCQEQITNFGSSTAKLRTLRSCSEKEIQTDERQESTPDTTQMQMTTEDPSPFFWSWPRYTVRKVFRRNLRVDYTCPSPADVNRNTLQSRPAMLSEMTLCQKQSWAGPKIHRHKCSTESTAHLCPLLRKLRVKERGNSQFLWNALIVKEIIISLQAGSVSVKGI